SKIFDQVEKIKSDGGGTGKTAGYVRLGSKFSTTVERRSKFSTGGFDLSRTFSTTVEQLFDPSRIFLTGVEIFQPPVEKRSEQLREVVERRSKFSTGGFDPSRIVRLRSKGGSTPVEHFRLESKFSGHRLKNDRNNRERWSDKFDYGQKFSTLVEWRRRRRGRDRDRWWWLK
ncbi:hypothetical protein TorRG33x02_324000, partial [Trema orientale]